MFSAPHGSVEESKGMIFYISFYYRVVEFARVPGRNLVDNLIPS